MLEMFAKPVVHFTKLESGFVAENGKIVSAFKNVDVDGKKSFYKFPTNVSKKKKTRRKRGRSKTKRGGWSVFSVLARNGPQGRESSKKYREECLQMMHKGNAKWPEGTPEKVLKAPAEEICGTEKDLMHLNSRYAPSVMFEKVPIPEGLRKMLKDAALNPSKHKVEEEY
jgi:hypothetical protein